MPSRRFQSVEDDVLVREARFGNRQAFDELACRFRGAITLIAYETLHSRANAEDVAQEVLVAAFYSLPRLRDPHKFASWLYAITRYRARRTAARERRLIPTEPSRLQSL